MIAGFFEEVRGAGRKTSEREHLVEACTDDDDRPAKLQDAIERGQSIDAATTADNPARDRSTIDETDISETMVAVDIAGEQIKFGDYGRLILPSVQINPAKNGQWIRWQRCEGGLKEGDALR